MSMDDLPKDPASSHKPMRWGTLVEAYQQAVYWCELPEQYVAIRIGQMHPTLDSALAQHAIHDWAYITAYNPFSQRSTPQQNRAMNRQLADDLGRRGYTYWRGSGIDLAGAWPPEASFLVLGIDRVVACDLARTYDQNAIVAGHIGEAAELIVLSNPSSPHSA
ncbi:hypothetical protein Pla52o_43650 [Novipirellula galeiformis]|uniref:DUF3293 domain-containing protein n=2 Tax=Novipirellula galeiformis TaxID=2528004 RepID=A0A5C6C912_9BACT|nr:hypothetical protein Pla52o_43650 [Novipirellula galeiformis]